MTTNVIKQDDEEDEEEEDKKPVLKVRVTAFACKAYSLYLYL